MGGTTTDVNNAEQPETVAPALKGQQARAQPVRVVMPGDRKIHIRFGLNAVCALCEPDLSRETLKSWMRRKWVVPVERGRDGRGNEARFSAWQTIAIAVAGAALRDMRMSNNYLGKAGVVSCMRAFAAMDDELLLPEEDQSPYTAERVAGLVSRAPGVDLTPAALLAVGRVVAAIDAKWKKQQEAARRTTGRAGEFIK